jgi:sortase, srtB family
LQIIKTIICHISPLIILKLIVAILSYKFVYCKKYSIIVTGEIMKKKKLFMNILMVIFILLFCYSIFKIINWKKDSDNTNKELNDMHENVGIKESTDNTEIVEQQESPKKDNPYWNYIKMSLIDVDFSKLKSTNEDIIGWITVNGTNINYPFVQTDNNTYYLDHSFNKKKNDAGWLFLDYRNNLLNNKNSIIYAHNRKDKTMFGSLSNTLKKSWFNETNNHIIKVSTEKENDLYQIFSIYHIPTSTDYLETDFKDDNEFIEFVNLIKNRSIYKFNTEVNTKDKILTLSTCYRSNEKLVVHAKLIKYEKKS